MALHGRGYRPARESRAPLRTLRLAGDWEAVDDASARATLRDGETTATLLFRFDADGLIASARAEARGRLVAGVATSAPREGRWEDYALRGGVRVPLWGEVAWMLPEGRKPYFRGRVTRLDYEFAR